MTKKTHKKSSKIAEPPKDLYVDSPQFLKKWHIALIKNRWLRGGILALILGIFAACMILLVFRLGELPDLSKLLPFNETVHYEEGNLASASLPSGTSSLRGIAEMKIGIDTATDSITTGRLEFYTIDKKKELVLDETRKIFKRYYVVAENAALFDSLKKVQSGDIEPVEGNQFFRNMRPSLAYQSQRFEFYSTEFWWNAKGSVMEKLFKDYGDLIADIFPLFGSVEKKTEVGTLTETYVAGNKESKQNLSAQYFFHLEKKYKGKLFDYLPANLKTIYSGESLATTINQLMDILDYGKIAQGEAAEDKAQIARIFEDKTEHFFATYFGPTVSQKQTIEPLLDNEYALGFFDSKESGEKELNCVDSVFCFFKSVSSPFVLAIELTPETTPLLEQLAQAFLAQGLVKIDRENSSIKSEKLNAERVEYLGFLYDFYKYKNNKPFMAALIKDDVAILTTGKSEMEQVINAMNGEGGYKESESYAMIEPMIATVDHLRADKSRAIGVNIFDDGFMIFTHER